LDKESPRIETHARLTSHGRRLVKRFLKNTQSKEELPSNIQIRVVQEFLRLGKETIDVTKTRIDIRRKIEAVLAEMAKSRELPLNVFKYLFRESTKSVLSAVEDKTIDITLKENQKVILREVIQFLKRICDRCGGEGEIPLGEGLQRKTCPECKGAGEIETSGINAEEFEKY